MHETVDLGQDTVGFYPRTKPVDLSIKQLVLINIPHMTALRLKGSGTKHLQHYYRGRLVICRPRNDPDGDRLCLYLVFHRLREPVLLRARLDVLKRNVSQAFNTRIQFTKGCGTLHIYEEVLGWDRHTADQN